MFERFLGRMLRHGVEQRVIALFATCFMLSACVSPNGLPPGFSYEGEQRAAHKVEFLHDMTYLDGVGQRNIDQEIFDRMFEIIDGAERFLLIDFFLFNDFQGPKPEHHRPLTRELTERLIARKTQTPDMRIVVITDPVNTIYGGISPQHFNELRQAGVEIYVTDLTKLPDSNPSWSGFWRLAIKPFGNSTSGWIPSPFSHDPVTVRSYMSFLNFKANHRKAVIADEGNDTIAMLTSGNPHDPSSAHSNVGVVFRGAAAVDLLKTENAILEMEGAAPFPVPGYQATSSNGTTIQVVTEGKVRDTLLAELQDLKRGDRLDMAMFFVSDRTVIKELKAIRDRGVETRLILDPNRTAFGFGRNGIPNVPSANELEKYGLSVRWCKPSGEQCHYKMVKTERADGRRWMTIGSTNLTRRNLNDLNLETNVVIRSGRTELLFQEVDQWFEAAWSNDEGRQYTMSFEENIPNSMGKTLLYRFMEGTGWAPF